MQAGALRALEFHLVTDALRSFGLTPIGRARLAELRPQTDPQRVAQWLAGTSEAVRYLGANPLFPLRAPSDLETILTALAIQGRALESINLLHLADYLDSVDQTATAIKRLGTNFPILRMVADAGASFGREIADVRRMIEPSGDVSDHASPELASIRDRLRKQRSRLRSILESFLRGKETSKYLQEQVVTDRNGRYVLVVRAEHRSSIPGIIHGSSASGASLFLEPLSTVEINNDIVALQEQEHAEIHRILLALTDAFRARPGDLARTIEMGTELDVLQAKARFSACVSGVEPGISTDGRLELRGARHPLLMHSVVSRLDVARPEGSIDAVPVDLLLMPPTTVLLMTGPNTGGKTVALKTVGLLALMAQSGLHVPAADGCRVPVFRSIFADIGDEQSLSASLSTFSSHIMNIAAMDRDMALPALVLLDEIGAGTDPVEGGALGVAIVDHFRTRGALVVSTTHYDALKSYAATTDGVMAAAFGFAPDTFAPTYRLIYGSPGRSLALEIARRLGLNAAIVDAAGRNLSERDAQLAEHLAKLDEDMRRLDHDRRLVAREREQIVDTESRLRTRDQSLQQREESFKQRLNERLDERLRAARAEIDEIMAELKRRTSELAAQAGRRISDAPLSTGEAGAARGDARSAVDEVVERLREEHEIEAKPTVLGPPPAIGDRVMVGTLGLEGRLLSLHEASAEVDVRGKRFLASRADLRTIDGRAPGEVQNARVSVNVQLQPRDGVRSELNVIGCSVDEALTRAEKFLDETLLTEERTVRVIHGYGTGQLRRAIAGFLERHPLVASFAIATPNQGGGGVTVIELKD